VGAPGRAYNAVPGRCIWRVYIYIPPLVRLHGYNIGKYEAKVSFERLHYRLQTGYAAGYKGSAGFGNYMKNEELPATSGAWLPSIQCIAKSPTTAQPIAIRAAMRDSPATKPEAIGIE
jgi:hypothetical protein